MSRVTITLVDIPDGVDVRLEFDPPARAGDRSTQAQLLAFQMLQHARSHSETEEEGDEG